MSSSSSSAEAGVKPRAAPRSARAAGTGGMCCNPKVDTHSIDFQETTGIYLPEIQLEGLAERAPWIAASPSRRLKQHHEHHLLTAEESYALSMGGSPMDETAAELQPQGAEVSADLAARGKMRASGAACCGVRSADVNIDGSELDVDGKPQSPVKVHISQQRLEGSLTEKMASDYLAPPRSPLETGDSHPASPPKAGTSITYAREAQTKVLVDEYTGSRSRSEIIVTEAEQSGKIKGPKNPLLACCQRGANYSKPSADKNETLVHGTASSTPVAQRMAGEYVPPATEGLPVELRMRYQDPTVDSGTIYCSKDHPVLEGKSPIHQDTDVQLATVKPSHGQPAARAIQAHEAAVEEPDSRKSFSSRASSDQPQSATDIKQGSPKAAGGGTWGLFKVCCDPAHGAPPPEIRPWTDEADKHRQIGQVDVERAGRGQGLEQNTALVVMSSPTAGDLIEYDETEPNQFKALDYLTRKPEEVYNIRTDGEDAALGIAGSSGNVQPRVSYSKDFGKGGWTTTAAEYGTGKEKAVAVDSHAATTGHRTAKKSNGGGIVHLCCNSSGKVDEGEGPYRLRLPGDSGLTEDEQDLMAPYVEYQVATDLPRSFAETRGKIPDHPTSTQSQLRAAATALDLVNAPNVKVGGLHRKTDKALFIGKINGTAFYNEVIAPAATAAARQQTWESQAYELVHPDRDPLLLNFVLGDDGLLRGHLIAANVEENRDCDFDCSFMAISSDDGSSKMYCDNYVTLPGPQNVLLKESEGLRLDVQQIVQDQSWTANAAVVHVTATKRDSFAGGDLRSDFEAMYRSEAYNGGNVPVADVTVVCEKEVLPATRAVLMARSKVFAEMLRSKAKAVVVVTGASPRVVKNLVDYMHTDRCELLSNFEDLGSLIKLFETSVRFAVASLMNEAAVRLIMNLNADSVGPIEAAANKTRHAFLIEAVNQFRKYDSV